METLAHGVAGSLGGALAMGVLYPLDQIKTIMQVERQVPSVVETETETEIQTESNPKVQNGTNQSEHRRRGAFWARALVILREQRWRVYQGHVSTQIALGGSNFVYFFCYNGFKAGLLKRLRVVDPKRYPEGSNVISPVQNLVLSCIAGIINVYATAPLWVANMRLKSKEHAKYNGVVDCIRKIVDAEGLWSLWNGTLASLLLVSNPVIHYVSYERMKTAIQLRRETLGRSGTLSAWEVFVLGAIAKSLTTVITYPLQVAQSLMRVQEKKTKALGHEQGPSAKQQSTSSDGIIACLTQICRNDGFAGLFAGLEAKLLQTVLTAAISLVTYEKLLAMILYFLKPRKSIVEKAQA